MQCVWCKVTGSKYHTDYIYEGTYNKHYPVIDLWGCNVLDFFLSTELIPKRRLQKWINRQGFGIRRTLILKWILLGNVLTMGYKSTLLSGLPLMTTKSSPYGKAIRRDQRQSMKQIYSNSILVEDFNENIEARYAAMYS